ncbi:hypothetical protein TVAG_297450 [Trichomonas vaginalis G3]|uniref:Tubby C-terminal domain-containing protein n=1 Tax=Trichomonas vaginalis (strain ATCC PRA-98 / G3) TaxID=412133 RepID=A2DRE0_TRIV3|nr:tubby protein, chain A domain-containing protein [Trichomonas vaginalis G3]EAY17066.1 hypothetical protein TVAG_297450 [Trichomonas vaginalis G3]KAI5517938.1 tubby protein, chain A domain-containing protein [Trichomonas vaginalis G3]|eukprot:XP_001329289.1 hypothetical protein [Trichomonas vaginalis G3]
MTVTSEPFLDDLKVVFQQTFILTDPTMNTSEVQYFHCRIPKTKLTDTKLSQVEPSVAPIPSETRQKSRLLESNTLQVSKVIQDKLETQNPVQAPNSPAVNDVQETKPSPQAEKQNLSPQPRRRIEAQRFDSPINKEPPEPTQPAASSPVKQSPQKPIDNGIEFKETIEPKSLLDYWTIPLKNQEITQFIFYRNENEFGLVDPTNKELQIKAIKRQTGVNIMLGGDKVAEIKQQDEDTFFCYTTEYKPYQELCAMKLNRSYAKDGGPILFELYIPALKKHAEGQRYVQIEGAETSGLVARVLQHAKEAIVMKTRVPQNQGSTFDLSFDTIFKNPDQHNFIVYHDSSPRRIVASLGSTTSNMYKTTVTYPMCPLQILFTCVACHLLD